MPDTMTVMLCVNDPDNGSPSGFIRQVELPDELITLEGPLKWDDDDDMPDPGVGATRFVEGGGMLHIGGAMFRHHGYATWVGNWCWNSAELTMSTVVALLNWLKKSGWDCTQAESGLFDRWREPGDLTLEELEAANAR